MSVISPARREQLHQSLDQMLDTLPDSLADCEKAEQHIRQGMQKLANQTLRHWAEEAKPSEKPSSCSQCQRKLRHRGRVRRQVQTTLGVVHYRHPRWRCEGCQQDYYPDGQWLCFGSHGVSGPLARLICRLMAWMPGEQVQQFLREDYGVRLSKERIQAISATAGEGLLKEWDRRSEEFQQRHSGPCPQPLPRGQGRWPQAAVYADGTMIHAEGQWREIRVGQVCLGRGEGGWERRRSFARFQDVDTFGRQLVQVAYQAGYGEAEQKVFLGDGARWLWELAELHFPDAIQVLDWYHLSQKVHETAREVYGEGSPEGGRWSQARLEELYRGQWRRTLRAVQQQRKRLRGKSKREALRRLAVYLRHNSKRMDYPRYRALGLPVGSGAVEGTCKHLVGVRCKGSGMRNWKRRRAEAILSLRAAILDGTFEHLWTTCIRQAA